MTNFILFFFGIAIWSVAFAQPRFILKDIGVIGLMSHDIFAWDHKREVNTENGRLDLSTIFDYDGGRRWKTGGNPKNSENAPVYTITMSLVNFYSQKMVEGLTATNARKATVAHFHKVLQETYERVREKAFPLEAVDQIPDNTEQAALRGMHDILPGRARLFGRAQSEIVLTNFFTAKTMLNQQELEQYLKPFDGDYDAEYRQIQIPFGPVIDLMEIDRKFIERFSYLRHSEMLTALAEVGREERAIHDVFFIHHIDDLFAKAICPIGNVWMPKYPCRK